MKNHSTSRFVAPALACVVGLAAGLVMTPAFAEGENVDSDSDPVSPFYNTFKVQQIESDFDNLDPAYNLGSVLAGVSFQGVVSWLSIELELGQTVIPGENTDGGGTLVGGNDGGGDDGGGLGGVGGGVIGGGDDGGDDPPNNTTSNRDLRFLSGAINTVARTSGPFYVGARLGYSKIFGADIEELDGESDVSFGALAGYRFGGFFNGGAVELDYTEMAGDLRAIGISFVTRY